MSEGGDATPRGAGGRVHPSLAAATTDPGAVRHGYNLRPKRKATQVADPLGDAVRTVIAPGEGEEANHRRVGGRDARAETDVDASGGGSEAWARIFLKISQCCTHFVARHRTIGRKADRASRRRNRLRRLRPGDARM